MNRQLLAQTLAEMRKALVAVIGALAIIASTGALTGNALIIVNGILAIATVTGVYVVPNRPVKSPVGNADGQTQPVVGKD